ncbi:MAG: DUF1648 domain-containing protein [Peptoniphilaceae bacterium]
MVEKKNKKIVVAGILAASIALGIFGYIYLPEMVTVQVDLSGNPSNTDPKMVAIASQTILTFAGAMGYYFSKGREKKWLVLALVGLIVSVITLVYNI